MSDDTRESFPFGDEPPGEGGNQPNGRPRTGDAEPGRTRQPDPEGTAIMPAADDPTRALPDDRTRMMPPVGDPEPGDRTRMMPPAGPAPGDPTAVLPPARGVDATSVHPPTPAGGDWADDDQVWAGRAGVRPPRPGDDPIGTDWAAVPADEPRGRWWTPIVVGIVGLILLALLAWGIYLILQSGDEDGGGTPTPAPAATTSAAAPRTTEPTTEPTSTAPTTTQPTTTAPTTPTDITIPALRGLSLDEARSALNRSGLNYRLRYVRSTEAPPGTVIDSDPPEGQQVPDDTIINLIIAAEPAATTTTPPTDPTDDTEGN